MAAAKEFPEDRFLVFATRNGHDQEDRALGVLATCARAASSRSASRTATSCSRCGSPTARIRSSSARATAWPSASTRPTSARWAATRPASAASRSAKDDDVVVEMDVVDEKAHAAHRHRERLRQAHRGRRVPRPGPRRLGRHQHQGHREERPGRRHQVRHRRRPAAAHHRAGPADPDKVKDIRETGRAAQGVRLIQLEEGDRVVAWQSSPSRTTPRRRPRLPCPRPPPLRSSRARPAARSPGRPSSTRTRTARTTRTRTTTRSSAGAGRI